MKCAALPGRSPAALEQAKEVFLAQDFPSVDDLEQMATAAGEIAQGIEAATEAFGSDDFPTVDELMPIAQRLAKSPSSWNRLWRPRPTWTSRRTIAKVPAGLSGAVRRATVLGAPGSVA